MNGEFEWAVLHVDQFKHELRQLDSSELRDMHQILRAELLDLGALLRLPIVEQVMAETLSRENQRIIEKLKESLDRSSYTTRAREHALGRLRLLIAQATVENTTAILAEIETYEDNLPEGQDGWMAEAGWQ